MKQLPAGALLGQNVRRLRQQQGLDTALLAKRLGWSEASLHALEDGKLDIDLDSIDLLSSVLKAAPRDLFEAECEDSERLGVKRYG